jgi:hypothetical protein
MKKLSIAVTLSLLLSMIVAQNVSDDADAEPQIKTTHGYVLEVQPDKFNFDEDWISIIPANKRIPIQKIVVINEDASDAGYEDLVAPCLVELSYMLIDGNPIPTQIRVLEQYRYDEHGFIIAE